MGQPFASLLSVGHRARPLRALVVLALLGTITSGAMAQALADRLPAELMRSTAPTPEQLDIIDKHLDYWVLKMRDATSDKDVSSARKILLDPMRSGIASGAFKDIYGGKLAALLQSCATSPSLVAKMNGLIIAAELGRGAATPLLTACLADPNSAVRYWAAKATAEIARNVVGAAGESPFTREQQMALLDGFKKALATETGSLVTEQMFRALAGLTIDESAAALLDGLEQRVAGHLKGLRDDLRADQKGLELLHQRFALERAQEKKVDAALKRLMTVAALDAQVVARTLQADSLLPLESKRVTPEVEAIGVDLVKSAETIFKGGLDQFDAQFPPGKDLAASAIAKQWGEVLLNLWTWTGTKDGQGVIKPGVLSESKIAIPAPALQLPEAAPTAPAPAAPAP